METSFDIERARFARRAREAMQGPPVFVCGLARAGTTVFMRLLHASGAFASPTYRDMPFPLAPNSGTTLPASIWQRYGASAGLTSRWLRPIH